MPGFDYHDVTTYSVNLAAGGNADVVAAVPGKRWAILCLVLTASGAAVVTVDSGATEIASYRLQTGAPLVIGDGIGIVVQGRAANEKLNIEAATADVDGHVQIVALQA